MAQAMSTVETDRLNEFRCDAQVAEELCQLANWPIRNLQVDGTSLSFKLVEKNEEKSFILNVSEDYPDNCILSCLKDASFCTVCCRVPELLDALVHNNNILLSTVNNMDVVEAGFDVQSSPADASSGSSDNSDSSSDNSETCVPCTDTIETDGSSDENNEFMMQEDFDMLEEVQVSPALDKDMGQVKNLFGEEAITYRLFTYIDNIDVELNINMDFLEETVAEAWNMNRREPLVVRLNVSLSSYLDNREVPKVEVFQPSKKDQPWGIGCQIKKIVETFIANQWRHVTNKDVLQARTVAPKSQSMPSHISERCSQTASPTQMKQFSHYADESCMNQPDSHLPLLSERNGNDTNSHEDNNNEMSPGGASAASSPSISAFSPIKAGKLSLGRIFRLATSATAPNLSNPQNGNLSLVPSSTADGERSKRIPCLEYGFLSQVYLYIRQRIPTLNEYCVVCDQDHVFQNGSMLQPAVCSRELCSFAFQDLGVMSTATTAMATGAEVVDLLISMTRTACKSKRREIIFNPYPTVIDPDKPTEFYLHPKHKDYKKVESILKAFPTMSEMLWCTGKDLKTIMDEKNRLAFPLLQWIITSNRSHIVKLPPTDQLKFMHTNHQFLLLSAAPAKEEIFRAARAKYGSTFAFHGSSIENWHSILRVGLLNASGTKYQMNGAAYGKGIYLSPISSISFSYSKMGHGFYTVQRESNNPNPIQPQHKNRFLQSENINCIALCEVIKSPELKKHGNVWVCTKSEFVCTRFFFVYEDSQVGGAEISTQRTGVENQILKAVQCRMNAMRDK